MSHRPHWTIGGRPIKAILFDRDGTLINDVPYNGDPATVRPIDGMIEFVAAARRAGHLLGVVTNQSGIARGLLTHQQVDAVNTEVERQLGPFDTWQICPHGPADGCVCRKPAPGLVLAACDLLGVPPSDALLVGDRPTDISAARAAGTRAVMVAAVVRQIGA